MAKIKKPSSKFKGILARPIRDVPMPNRTSGTSPSLASLDRLQDRRQKSIDAQREERLRALHDHYGIDQAQPIQQALRMLVIRLAEEIVPGFRVVSAEHRTGRHERWNLQAQIELLEAVAKMLNRNKRLTPKSACRRLAERDKRYEKLKGDSLYTTYLTAKGRIPDYLLLKAVLAHPRGRGLSNKNEDGILDAVFRPKK